MAKTLPAGIVTQLDAGYRRPVLLFTLGLASTVRFAAARGNVTFPTAGDVYTAKAIQFGSISFSAEGQIRRITIQFDNVAQDMAAYADHEDFIGKSLVIKRIFLDDIDAAADYVELFNGKMEMPKKIDQNWLTVTAVEGKILTEKLHIRKYHSSCPWRFGGTECNTDGNADLTSLTATGTADSGSTTTLVDNALTEVDDYWNDGNIEIVKSGVTYHRKVLDFAAATDEITFDVALTFAVDNTCTYTVYKGCFKTWAICKGGLPNGPSADNKANFGGFLHTPSESDLEGTGPTGWGVFDRLFHRLT